MRGVPAASSSTELTASDQEMPFVISVCPGNRLDEPTVSGRLASRADEAWSPISPRKGRLTEHRAGLWSQVWRQAQRSALSSRARVEYRGRHRHDGD